VAETVDVKNDSTELDAFYESLADKNGALIPMLHKAQEVFGYLSEETQLYIARSLKIPASKVFGVVAFYSLFNTEPKGKYRINVCMGTACYVLGAEKLLESFESELEIKRSETTEDGMFTIDAVRCIGTCGLAPAVMVNDKVFGRVKTDDVKNIIEEYLHKEGEANG
jgi:NADH:ubiquinone oxidoreductase subunit E